MLGGGDYSLVRVVELLPGKYLCPPQVTLIPTEFVKVEWLTGRPRGRVTDERAPDFRWGGEGRYVLYRHSDGTLTEFGQQREDEAERRKPCPHCGRSG